MDHADLHARLMDEAKRYDPAEYSRSRLAPFRDVLLVWRAKSMSYEQIAASLTKHGLKISPAGVGAFCRRTFSQAEFLREQTRLRTEKPTSPAATAPSFPGLSAVAPPVPAPLPPGRRGPKIARDNY
jgi:hypothetical protein